MEKLPIHTATIAQQTEGRWGVICDDCSSLVQDYVKCDHLAHLPDVLYEATEKKAND